MLWFNCLFYQLNDKDPENPDLFFLKLELEPEEQEQLDLEEQDPLVLDASDSASPEIGVVPPLVLDTAVLGAILDQMASQVTVKQEMDLLQKVLVEEEQNPLAMVEVDVEEQDPLPIKVEVYDEEQDPIAINVEVDE